jgi:hypothetical protein
MNGGVCLRQRNRQFSEHIAPLQHFSGSIGVKGPFEKILLEKRDKVGA